MGGQVFVGSQVQLHEPSLHTLPVPQTPPHPGLQSQVQESALACIVGPQPSAPVSQTHAQRPVSNRNPTPQVTFWRHSQPQLAVLQVKLPAQRPPQSGGQTHSQIPVSQTSLEPQPPPQSAGQTHLSVTGSQTRGSGHGPPQGRGLPSGLGVRSSQY